MKIIFRKWDFGNTHNHVGQHVLSSGQREAFVIPRKLCDARTLLCERKHAGLGNLANIEHEHNLFAK